MVGSGWLREVSGKIAGKTQQKGGEIQGRALGNMKTEYPLEAPTEGFVKQTEAVQGGDLGRAVGDQGTNFSGAQGRSAEEGLGERWLGAFRRASGGKCG